MQNLSSIKSAISSLGESEFTTLRTWILEIDADIWDGQMERGMADGMFDEMIEEAVADDAAGKSEEL